MKWTSNRLAALLLLALILAAISVLLMPGSSYSVQDRSTIFGSATPQHLAGTDALGRDRLVRSAGALLIGLFGSITAAAITTALAAAAGMVAAFSPRLLCSAILLLCDVFLALPWLFLLMIVRSALPLTASPAQSAVTTFLVLAALGWPACARAIHGGVRDLRQAPWMLQARAQGLRPTQIMRYLVPNLRPLLFPQFLICIPAFIVAEANLGALGLGIGEPLPSWGGMLLELDNSAMLLRTHWVYLPVILLVLTLVLLEAQLNNQQAEVS